MKLNIPLLGLVFIITGFVGCKPTQSVISNDRSDSIVYIEKIDTIKELVFGDSLLLESLVWCDSLNQAQMNTIDSLGKKLSVKAKIKGNKLIIRVKEKNYFKEYIFYKTMYGKYSVYKKQETKIIQVKEPLNYYLIIALFLSIIINIISIRILILKITKV